MGLYEREVVVLSWNKVVEVGCAVLFINANCLGKRTFNMILLPTERAVDPGCEVISVGLSYIT